MMMEVKKRPASPDDFGPAPKKRIISASDWSKPIRAGFQQGEDDEEDMAGEQLEKFRKEAIYRRMKHYARLYETSEQRIKALEAHSKSRDEAVAALEATWKQLISNLESVIPNSKPTEDLSSYDIYNITYSLNPEFQDGPAMSETYRAKLSAASNATQHLVASLVQRLPNASMDVQELRSQNAALTSQTSAYHAEAVMLRCQIQEKEKELEDVREKLATSENRVERVRSETVLLLESKLGTTLVKEEEDQTKAVPVANGTPQVANGMKHETTPSLDDSWHAIAEVRSKQLEEQENENRILTEENMVLKVQIHTPSEAVVQESVAYKRLLAELSTLKTAADEARAECRSLEEQVTEAREVRLESQRLLASEAKTKIDELKSQLNKALSDCNRLRGMRDALNTENTNLKTKDHKIMNSVQMLKTNYNFQKERIDLLVKENQRLRGALAVSTADRDLYAFIADNPEENATYVSSLKSRLKDAESKVIALEQTIEDLNSGQSDTAALARSEAELRKLYSEAQQRLDKYERVYGSGSGSNGTGPVEPQKLVALLAEKDEKLNEIMDLKRKDDERYHGRPSDMDELCRQIEELIATRDKEISNQAALEERVNKAQMEKAKADTKYFSAMRSKDAADAQLKVIEASMNKQLRRIEKLQETEAQLKQQIHSLEKMNTSARFDLSSFQQLAAQLEDEQRLSVTDLNEQAKRITELEREARERQDLADTRRHQLRKLEEEVAKLKREATKAEQKRQLSVPRSGSPTDLEKTNDNLMKLLRCSTCKNELRTHVLTKCMHTFCKTCIDARLSTRQRKCPACQLAFAQSDVQMLYFQ